MTNSANGKIHLWAFLQGIGFFPGGWRDEKAQPSRVFERSYYEDIARMVEAACFDAIVFGDQLQGRDAAGRTPERLAIPTLDPFTLLSVMGGVTERVGLVATVSTTYAEPGEVAAKFAALNYLSDGRAGWNIVTTAHPNSAWNFGEPELLEKALRYKRAAGFVDATEHVWKQAVGEAGGAFANEWFAFDAARGTPTAPQGRPAIVQAGQSEDGRDFAASCAEAVFCPAPTIEAGQEFRNDIRARAAAKGRDPDGLIIMPGLAFVLGDTEDEARAKHARMLDFADDGLCIEYLSESIGYDLTRHAPDGPIPIEDICASCEFPAGMIRAMLQPSVDAGKTLVEHCRDYATKPRGHNIFVGTPEQMAEMMATWVDAGACDGFTLQPGFMPAELEIFCEKVVPILQEKGVLRRAYQGPTLREHLGLSGAPW
ncbi:monooxygenase [Novosphingobium sp. PC22D]|uniref:LLM class flavin-dependent oxidoreductase n=1 Tax=Novosphingobium sp. PC22D TaxID=1962403 RepID=UPI000BF0FE35|nr:LLM class flavin-dependent oxidoreductase [Novosphingobium sp. PC22D]PEQ11410.1 monooxygenase [Novosphingobium sp. PC22D]